MSGITPKLPLSFDNKHGYNLIKKYKNLATQNLKNLILTSPGERIMDPTFGVGLRSFLFQLDHDLTRAEIISRIEDQVKKYLPFIQIDQVIFNSSSEFSHGTVESVANVSNQEAGYVGGFTHTVASASNGVTIHLNTGSYTSGSVTLYKVV